MGSYENGMNLWVSYKQRGSWLAEWLWTFQGRLNAVELVSYLFWCCGCWSWNVVSLLWVVNLSCAWIACRMWWVQYHIAQLPGSALPCTDTAVPHTPQTRNFSGTFFGLKNLWSKMSLTKYGGPLLWSVFLHLFHINIWTVLGWRGPLL